MKKVLVYSIMLVLFVLAIASCKSSQPCATYGTNQHSVVNR